MREKPMDSWRTRAAVSEALDVFNSNYMQEVWSKAIARRQMDPDGAVTSARQLLESVCKHILTDAEQPFKEGIPLPDLYKLAARQLEIAPSEHTAAIFTTLFSACAEIVSSIGKLRNHLSDSHGHGPFGSMPDWRHAELAVNLSAAMATYLAAVWAGRQPTVGDVIEKFIADAEATEPLGLSHLYTLETILASPISKVIASKVQTTDVMAHWQARRASGKSAATVMHDITYLRGALGGEGEDAIYRAIQILTSSNEVRKYVPRNRRVSDDDVQKMVEQLREPPKKLKTTAIQNMPEFVEFALWSGRTLDEICSLQWKDVDFENKTCKLPGSQLAFPVLGRAWDILVALNPSTSRGATQNIFHDNPKSVGATFRIARAKIREKLGKEWGNGLTLDGFRYEAVCRLLESEHPVHLVSEATGQGIGKVHQIYKTLRSPTALLESEGSARGGTRASRRRRRSLRGAKQRSEPA